MNTNSIRWGFGAIVIIMLCWIGFSCTCSRPVAVIPVASGNMGQLTAPIYVDPNGYYDDTYNYGYGYWNDGFGIHYYSSPAHVRVMIPQSYRSTIVLQSQQRYQTQYHSDYSTARSASTQNNGSVGNRPSMSSQTSNAQQSSVGRPSMNSQTSNAQQNGSGTRPSMNSQSVNRSPIGQSQPRPSMSSNSRSSGMTSTSSSRPSTSSSRPSMSSSRSSGRR